METGILLVDDEELILNSLARELRPWLEGHNLLCYQARSGEAALALLEAHSPHILVVVTDLRMPGLSGDQLVAEAKKRWPLVEAVLISGYAEMQGLSRAIAAGVRSFLPKPWEHQALLAELDKVLQTANQARQDAEDRLHQAQHLARTADIQRTLFRNDALDPRHFRLSLVYRPLENQFCGGDFYEIVRLSDNRCVILVGDVGGHGPEAAFITGVLHTLIAQDEIYNLLAGSASPGYLLSRLNGLFFDHLVTEDSRTVALTILLFDRADDTLQVASAGGLSLVRIRGGEGEAVPVRGFPMGLAPDTHYEVQVLPLAAGDRWVVLTDGLVDRGRAGFLAESEVVRTVSASDSLEAAVDGFQGQFPDRRFLDDLTLLSVEVV